MNQNISFMKMKLMEEFQEGNAFTKALAKTPKGGEFKIGGKSMKDTSNYDDSNVKEEMLCKECGGMMYEGQCESCGYMEEANLYGDPDHRYGVDDGQPDDADSSDAGSSDGGIGEGMDHEVSMAKSTLQDIVSNASQLMNKIGDEEIDIPAWIQDHITNAANYIAQANTGYHEYGTGGDETPDEEEPTSLTTMMETILKEKKKPSAGLSKSQKSTIVKKAQKGGDIGKKGKGFADVEKAAKAGGAKDPKAVAAAAMWKGAAKRAHK